MSLRIQANENVPGPVVRRLRELGHDVTWVRETQMGARDREVLASAQKEKRVLLTMDKGFGELALKQRVPASHGIVLLRLGGSAPATDNERVVEALASRSDWGGVFAVVEDDSIRVRPMPTT